MLSSKTRSHRLLVLALALAAVPLFSGCGTFLSLLKINPDGSGTLVQTTQLGAMASSFMQQSADDGQGGKIVEERVRAFAERLGEGVRFVEMEQLSGSGKGYRATYAFDDVTKVRLSLQEQINLDMSGSEAFDPEDSDDSPITFGFAPGTPATLTMNLGGMIDKSDGPQSGTLPDTSQIEQQMGMMRMMFQDAEMGVFVEPQGALVSTNAAYHDGGRITLMHMDFNEILADPDAFKRLIQSSDENLSDAEQEQMMRDLPGIRAEISETVTMRFR